MDAHPRNVRLRAPRLRAARLLANWLRQGWWLLPPLVLVILGGWVVARRHGLWYDELYTAEVAPLPVGRLISAVIHGEGTIPYLRDAPPSYGGPYYLVTHLWLTVTRLPADEVGLRLLSLVAAVGGVGVFTRVVGRLAGPGVAVVAGLIAATNPFVVQYSAEARGYGIALLATSLAALGLAWWLDGKPRSLLLYGLAGAAAGLAHWFALLALGGMAVAALLLRRRQALGLVAVTAAAALPAAALILLAIGNGVGASGAWWLSDVGGAVPRLLLKSWAGGRTPLLVVTVVAAVAGLVLGGRAPTIDDEDEGGRIDGGRRDARLVAACWFGVPVATVTMLEVVRPVFVDRYLLPSTLGLAVLVALGITRAPRRLVPAALAVVLGASVWATVAETRLGPKEDVRGAVAVVAAAHRPGQPVVAAARWDALGLDHYARADHPALVPDMVLPPAAVPPAATVWVVRRAKGGVKGDRDKLESLDTDLAARGLRVSRELRLARSLLRHAGAAVGHRPSGGAPRGPDRCGGRINRRDLIRRRNPPPPCSGGNPGHGPGRLAEATGRGPRRPTRRAPVTLDRYRRQREPGGADGGHDAGPAQVDDGPAGDRAHGHVGPGVRRQAGEPGHDGPVDPPRHHPPSALVCPPAPGEDRPRVARGQPVEKDWHRLRRVLQVGVEAHPRDRVLLVGQAADQGPVLADVGLEGGYADAGIGGRQPPGHGQAGVG